MKSPIIIGILGLPFVLCSCFPWSTLPYQSINNNQKNIEEKKITTEIPTVKEVWNTLDQQFTILGYLPSIDCSTPKISPLGATSPWVSAYQMSCKIKDKNKIQEELAYVKRVFSAGSSFWNEGIQFSEYQAGVLLLNDDIATFQLERMNGLATNQSALYFKSREARYNFALKIQNNIGEITPSNIPIKESLNIFPASIQKYFQTLSQADSNSKVILNTSNGYWYSHLWMGTAMPIPEGLNIFESKWPKINNEGYHMTILYSGSYIWDTDKAEMDFMANPRNVEAVYLEGNETSFLLTANVLK